jgi:hypothetical protein
MEALDGAAPDSPMLRLHGGKKRRLANGFHEMDMDVDMLKDLLKDMDMNMNMNMNPIVHDASCCSVAAHCRSRCWNALGLHSCCVYESVQRAKESILFDAYRWIQDNMQKSRARLRADAGRGEERETEPDARDVARYAEITSDAASNESERHAVVCVYLSKRVTALYGSIYERLSNNVRRWPLPAKRA